MIDFNVPLYIGKETDYMKEAIENKKICGDGMFTKKCNQWIEEKTGTKKALLTTSCTHATELAALLADIKEGDEVTVVMNEHVDYNGKQYPIASLPENLMSIIQAGGLVKAMRKLNGLD